MIDLSVVVPACDPAQRLAAYLAGVRAYLRLAYGGAYEVLVVEDGSPGDVAPLLARLGAPWPELSCLRHETNRGRGAAVRTGVQAARGRLILIADANGATPIEEEARLRRPIERGADVAVGSRRRAGGGVGRRCWYRDLAGYGLARVVGAVTGLDLADAQCGFRMFRQEAARRLVRLSREPGCLFDVEVLALAQRLCYRIAEVPIRWNDVPGPEVRVMRDGWRMACGLLRLRRSLREIAPCWEAGGPGLEALPHRLAPETPPLPRRP